MITLLNQPWAERLGLTLLHFVWQGILLAALYALARTLAGSRIAARGRYAMACASLTAMMAAPACTYWWLGNAGQAPPAGNAAALRARQPVPAAAYSPFTDPWQSAMPWIVMTNSNTSPARTQRLHVLWGDDVSVTSGGTCPHSGHGCPSGKPRRW